MSAVAKIPRTNLFQNLPDGKKFCPPHFQFVLLWYFSQASPVQRPAQLYCQGIFDVGAENHLGQYQEVGGNITASPVKAMGLSYYKRNSERKENNSSPKKGQKFRGSHWQTISTLYFFSQATTGLTPRLNYCSTATSKQHLQLQCPAANNTEQNCQEHQRILLRNYQQEVAERC